MAARVQQAAVVLLAMQFDQRIRQRPQHLARGPAVIDPGGLAAISGVDPAQDQLVLHRQAGFGQNCQGRVAGRQIETGGHFALFGTAAHQFRPPAPTEHEPQGIQQNGFAGPSLASQNIQPGLKGQ